MFSMTNIICYELSNLGMSLLIILIKTKFRNAIPLLSSVWMSASNFRNSLGYREWRWCSWELIVWIDALNRDLDSKNVTQQRAGYRSQLGETTLFVLSIFDIRSNFMKRQSKWDGHEQQRQATRKRGGMRRLSKQRPRRIHLETSSESVAACSR